MIRYSAARYHHYASRLGVMVEENGRYGGAGGERAKRAGRRRGSQEVSRVCASSGVEEADVRPVHAQCELRLPATQRRQRCRGFTGTFTHSPRRF